MTLIRMPSVMEIAGMVDETCRKCMDRKTEFESLGKDALSGCFGLLHNASRMTMELLTFYNQIWQHPFAGDSEELKKLQKDNVERVVMITKWNFVNSISCIEYSIKEFAKSKIAFSGLYASRKRIYLGQILNRSLNLTPRLVEPKVFNEWICLLEVRNTVVHNNGISDTDKECLIGGVSVKFVKDTMITGGVTDFVRLTDAVCDFYYAWAKVARQSLT
jgi:hypothetical protein